MNLRKNSEGVQLPPPPPNPEVLTVPAARCVLVRLNVVEAKTNCFANFIARSNLALHPIVVRPWLRWYRWYSVDRFLFFSDDPTFVSLMVHCSASESLLYSYRQFIINRSGEGVPHTQRASAVREPPCNRLSADDKAIASCKNRPISMGAPISLSILSPAGCSTINII